MPSHAAARATPTLTADSPLDVLEDELNLFEGEPQAQERLPMLSPGSSRALSEQELQERTQEDARVGAGAGDVIGVAQDRSVGDSGDRSDECEDE